MPLINDLLELAEQAGCADLAGCETALREAALQQRSLVTAVLEQPGMDENRFLRRVAELTGTEWWEQPVEGIPAPLREAFPVRLAFQHHLLPVQAGDGGTVLLHYDPFNLLGQQMVRQGFPGQFRYALSTRRNVLEGLRQGYGIGAETFEQLLEGREADTSWMDMKQEVNVLDHEDSEASVVKFVNQILREALHQRATDIHVEPLENDLRIRYRIDGVLHEIPVPPRIKLLQTSVISRLKIMGQMDIAERRLPQDGRITLELEGKEIDVRMATLPSVTGESVSLRLLASQAFTVERLALDPAMLARIHHLLAMPNGIILMTGPTGCGKSSTLYAFLTSLNTQSRRIVTIEDPVEHKLSGVVQIAVKPEIDLSFARALRSILRGDPNVIMVGEMRDFETAEIAIRAALTGHLVFSTLHTNDAVGGITRLVDMGVEPFLVANSVRAFIAQRLVRLLCPECKQPAEHPETYFREVGFPEDYTGVVFKPVGCERCRQTGYLGRIPIVELCEITPRLQDLIINRAGANELKQVAAEDGMVPLRQAGWVKVMGGQTTIEEVVRVTAADLEVLDE